ncbi:MAG: DUF3524 domain-containing protein [Chloroflexi bacterium]|nr:DUF3524 domain-containing protein [Chloroflexota bacterium]
MRVVLLEPYFTGSHRAWAEGYQAASREHAIEIWPMEGRFWKWRMHGAALELASRCQGMEQDPDLLLVTDMVNLPYFLGLTRPRFADTPIAAYFHETQLSYPLAPAASHDLTYGFMNFMTGLCADWVFFNSAFHREQFFDELPRLLKHFPDYNHLETVPQLRAKSSVLPVGCDLRRLDAARESAPPRTRPPLVLWNQRWEYDKQPEVFFRALAILAEEGVPFRLALAGENFRQKPQEFLQAKEAFAGRLVHYGHADADEYARLLWQADVVVSTAIHEFFGIAIVESIYCGAWPLLPKRLVYPELIPPSLHETHLYEDFEDLVRRLRQILLNPTPPAPALREAMRRYDWACMAPEYDRALTAVHEARASDRNRE